MSSDTDRQGEDSEHSDVSTSERTSLPAGAATAARSTTGTVRTPVRRAPHARAASTRVTPGTTPKKPTAAAAKATSVSATATSAPADSSSAVDPAPQTHSGSPSTPAPKTPARKPAAAKRPAAAATPRTPTARATTARTPAARVTPPRTSTPRSAAVKPTTARPAAKAPASKSPEPAVTEVLPVEAAPTEVLPTRVSPDTEVTPLDRIEQAFDTAVVETVDVKVLSDDAVHAVSVVAVTVDSAVVDESVVYEPVVDEPVIDEPVIDEPSFDEPVFEATVVDESVVLDDLSVVNFDAVADERVDVVALDEGEAQHGDAEQGDAEQGVAGRTASEAVLSLTGLVKRFGSTIAVDGVDLEVQRGGFYGIVGPNGAGKTTTLSMITGLVRPDEGIVRVNGHDVWKDPADAKRIIGILPDKLRLFDRLTGRQLLHYSGSLRGLNGQTVRERADELAEAFGIQDALNRLVSDYSAGMTKKVALAASMIHSPRLLVLDEPFESVDPVSADTVTDILQKYVAAGGTVVLSSHSMEMIERVCDGVAIIVHGRVLTSGTVDHVRNGSTLEDRFIELAGGHKAVEGMEWLLSSLD
ncbi:ABC transporter ATP-binding protein [Subtercola endophyticus]|uniref:ABC transporter ATP-binding protein n=1 Tax=Subtercola endophyticus TaxID=2895559 RepID=UPI001E3D75AE|nr:ABC transporter ATP-binding protein [Subtercola endophyticus]UFS59960.1 ATP-binding cassette domain-containing protein [Subtercola endophyticus]